MTDYSGRMLWMYIMPGLTDDLLLEVADDLGFETKFRFSTLTDDQLGLFELGCRKRLGLPEDWDKDVSLSGAYPSRKKGWGKSYGPGS